MPLEKSPNNHYGIIDMTNIEERFQLSQQDFNRFADLSGDHNPIHVDPEYSANTRFGATVSHGMLLFTVLRGCLYRYFPEYRLIEQKLMFPAPAYANETLTLQLEQSSAGTEASLAFTARILNADGNTCLEGRCLLEPNTGSSQ